MAANSKNNTAGDKDSVREELIARRNEITEQQHREWSDRIIQTLKVQSEFQEAKTVHCYVSMNKRREVDTHSMLKELVDSQKQVAVPVMEFGSNRLHHHRLKSFEELVPNDWGVPEPVNIRPIQPTEFDLIIVPMAGGDEQCNRMGYGKGYYDRFLKEAECPAIGLSYECTILPSIPADSHDVALTRIITEKRVIQ